MSNQHFCNVHFFMFNLWLFRDLFPSCVLACCWVMIYSVMAPIGSSPSFQRCAILSKAFIRPTLSISLLHPLFCCEIWRHTFKEHFFFLDKSSMTYDLCGTQGDIIQNDHTSLFHILKVESDHGELRSKNDKILL